MAPIQILTAAEQQAARSGGHVLRSCLDHLANIVEPGQTTLELDAIAEDFIRSHTGATPAFKGYQGFPGTLCTSVNHQCVHGLPGQQTLKDGDIIAIDCGVLFGGINTDACVTVGVGSISPAADKLLNTTQAALKGAVKLVKAGTRVGDISAYIQTIVEGDGFYPVRSLTGHGLGYTMHQFPDIPNLGTAGTGVKLPAGALIAIEPIVAVGTGEIAEDGDGWTISIRDGSLSAHFEHSLLVQAEGCEIVA